MALIAMSQRSALPKVCLDSQALILKTRRLSSFGDCLTCDVFLLTCTVEALRQGTFGTTDLSTLGLAEAAERDIGPLDIICVGWNICNSWIGLAATIALTIAQGGSVTLIYGVIVCFVMVGCSGLTLAELASVYPTAGGQ